MASQLYTSKWCVSVSARGPERWLPLELRKYIQMLINVTALTDAEDEDRTGVE